MLSSGGKQIEPELQILKKFGIGARVPARQTKQGANDNRGSGASILDYRGGIGRNKCPFGAGPKKKSKERAERGGNFGV